LHRVTREIGEALNIAVIRACIKAVCFGALFQIGLTAQAQSAETVLNGTYNHDCAPYDGPAFIVILPRPSGTQDFQFKANVPLQQALGTWRHSDVSSPKHAVILLCSNKGVLECAEAKTGQFRVTALTGDTMRGSANFGFEDGRHFNFVFSASRGTPPTGRGMCG
jgi:hypothetical protein